MAKTIIHEHVHEPQINEDSSSSYVGPIILVLSLLLIVFLIFNYGLPYINRATAPQVQIPDNVDVNINQK